MGINNSLESVVNGCNTYNGIKTIEEKLRILADAAKYDVACTSSGVNRSGKSGYLGNSVSAGICHSFAADGRCISLLKILMTNHCIYDCKYCINRCSNDVERATFTPDEICTLTTEFYKRNYIEGLFLSSGVINDPGYTMEKIVETLRLLRTKYRFNGYVHVKTIPGAPDELIAQAGYLADRISVNMELPTAESLAKLAPNKHFNTILKPMSKISSTIAGHRAAIGKSYYMERSGINGYLSNSIFNTRDSSGYASVTVKDSGARLLSDSIGDNSVSTVDATPFSYTGLGMLGGANSIKREFAPGGQSTQMIIGATDETDYNLIRTTQGLYQTYDLKRVFYSAYIPINEDVNLPAKGTAVPLLREHRLYQADWLMRFYGFQADELLSPARPNFNEQLDPKCDWAIRHLEQFPVEIMTAPMEKLLRVPGIGPKSAQRIVQARRLSMLDFDSLKKVGVVLKRAHYFITCNGKMMYRIPIEEQFITRQLTMTEEKDNWKVSNPSTGYQMTIFDYLKQA